MAYYGDVPDALFGASLVLFGVVALAFARRYGDNVRAMVATARSDVGALPGSGLVEVSGRVHEVPDPLTAPVSGADCIGYALDIEEYRRRDDIAKEWVNVDRLERATPFVLTDDTGTVTVDPGTLDDFRREVSYPERETREVDEGAPPGLEVDVADAGDDEYPRRYRERRLPATGDLYVLGTAGENGDRIENGDGEPFVLSADGERRTALRHAAYAAIAVVVGVALVAWGSYLVLGQSGLL